MATGKAFLKNNSENLEQRVSFQEFYLHLPISCWIRSCLLPVALVQIYFFSVTFILGSIVNFFMAINFIKSENKN